MAVRAARAPGSGSGSASRSGSDGTRTRAPGPPGLPLVGVAPQVRRDPLAFFPRMLHEYGDIVDLKVAGQRLLLVNDPEAIAHVLQRNAENYRKSRFYDPLKPVAKGLLTSEGEQWLSERRAAAPAFRGPSIAHLCAGMAAQTDAMLDGWEDTARQGRPMDVAREMYRLTLQIAVRTLFGSTMANARAEAISDALFTALREAERRIWSVFPLPLWLPTPRHRAFAAAVRLLDDTFEEMVARRRAEGPGDGDLLDMLLEAFSHDRRQLRDTVVSLMVAGHETTAVALGWSFQLLALHPEWGEAVGEEAERVLGDGVPDMQAVHDLTTTRAVFEEAMRLYPPVWTFSRDALAPDHVGGVSLRKGETVMICAYALHRDAARWPDPATFRPERFLESAGRARHGYAYLPFGGGPRTCLGNRFALAEGSIVLARTLQRYALEPVPDHPVEPEPMITLRPRHGLRLYLRPRP